MKQKTTFITLALIVAVLALGVAYAAITTQTLNVVGNVTTATSDDNFDVHFSGTPGIERSETVGENENKAKVSANSNGRTATLSIGELDTKNESVTVTFPITNSSPDLGATLSEVDITGGNDTWFTIDADLSSRDLAANGGTANLVVTVTLKDTPATDAEAAAATADFYIEFTADAK